MYLNIFHVDTSLAPSQHPYLTLTPPSLALIIFKIHVHVPKYISCEHIPCTLTTPILHTHTPTSPSSYFTNTNNLIDYIFSIYRFTYVSKAWGMEPKDFDPILNKYVEDITEQETSDGFTGAIMQVCPHMNSREQFDMLGTMSNYHALGFPSLRDTQKIKTPNISLYEHIAMPENKCYIPASPHNRIIYFIKSGEKEHLRNYIKFLEQYNHIPHFHTDEPPRKKPRLTGWVKRVDSFRVKQKYLSPELVEMI